MKQLLWLTIKKRTNARTKIDNAKDSQNALYCTLKELTGLNEPPQYPDASDAKNSNDFVKFFVNKVNTIRENLSDQNCTDFTSTFTSINNLTTYLDSFEPCTIAKISDIIKTLTHKIN